jgi:hypothetical protein
MSTAEEKIKELARHTFGTWNRQKAWTSPILIRDAEAEDTGVGASFSSDYKS